MTEKENVHKGHRQRMIERCKINSGALLDHELLEVLLYPIIPRVNTNPIAHRLISTFGSIEKVFSAGISELMAVSGVGEKVATQINVIGALIGRVNDKTDKSESLWCFEAVKKHVEKHFKDKTEEKFLLFLLDKKYVKLATVEFDDGDVVSIKADVKKVANALLTYKPQNVLLTHNHASGIAQPSEQDDLATKKLNLICMAHGINLVDHVIYAKGNTFSYVSSGRLDKIKKSADLNAMLNSLNNGEKF